MYLKLTQDCRYEWMEITFQEDTPVAPRVGNVMSVLDRYEPTDWDKYMKRSRRDCYVFASELARVGDKLVHLRGSHTPSVMRLVEEAEGERERRWIFLGPAIVAVQMAPYNKSETSYWSEAVLDPDAYDDYVREINDETFVVV